VTDLRDPLLDAPGAPGSTVGSRAEAIERLLDPQQVVLFDGAMGTMLYARGVFINQCYDELSLRAPDLVRDVHAQYVAAGADVLETNSFGASRVKLAQYGLETQVREINQAAARVAREAADADHPAQRGTRGRRARLVSSAWPHFTSAAWRRRTRAA